jgi:hypothetical protein
MISSAGSPTHTLGCALMQTPLQCIKPLRPVDPQVAPRSLLTVPARPLQGKLRTSDTHNSTTRFEIVELPKLGTFGWNNSLAGRFIYSPTQVTRLDRSDNFTYRAVNEYGESNWAAVTIEFVHDNESDGMLKVLVGIAIISTFMSLGGLVRVVILQLLLNPQRRFQGPFWQALAVLMAPPVEEFVSLKTAADFKHKMHDSDEEDETTDNPVAKDSVQLVDDTDEFT